MVLPDKIGIARDAIAKIGIVKKIVKRKLNKKILFIKYFFCRESSWSIFAIDTDWLGANAAVGTKMADRNFSEILIFATNSGDVVREKIIELKLNSEEKELLDSSAKAVKDVMNVLDKMNASA